MSNFEEFTENDWNDLDQLQSSSTGTKKQRVYTVAEKKAEENAEEQEYQADFEDENDDGNEDENEAIFAALEQAELKHNRNRARSAYRRDISKLVEKNGSNFFRKLGDHLAYLEVLLSLVRKSSSERELIAFEKLLSGEGINQPTNSPARLITSNSLLSQKFSSSSSKIPQQFRSIKEEFQQLELKIPFEISSALRHFRDQQLVTPVKTETVNNNNLMGLLRYRSGALKPIGEIDNVEIRNMNDDDAEPIEREPIKDVEGRCSVKFTKIHAALPSRLTNQTYFYLGDYTVTSSSSSSSSSVINWKCSNFRALYFYKKNKRMIIYPIFEYSFHCVKVSEFCASSETFVVYEITQFVPHSHERLLKYFYKNSFSGRFLPPQVRKGFQTANYTSERLRHMIPAPFCEEVWHSLCEMICEAFVQSEFKIYKRRTNRQKASTVQQDDSENAEVESVSDAIILQQLRCKVKEEQLPRFLLIAHSQDFIECCNQQNPRLSKSSILFEHLLDKLPVQDFDLLISSKDLKLYFMYTELNFIIHEYLPSLKIAMNLTCPQMILMFEILHPRGDQHLKQLLPLLFLRTTDTEYLHDNIYSIVDWIRSHKKIPLSSRALALIRYVLMRIDPKFYCMCDQLSLSSDDKLIDWLSNKNDSEIFEMFDQFDLPDIFGYPHEIFLKQSERLTAKSNKLSNQKSIALTLTSSSSSSNKEHSQTNNNNKSLSKSLPELSSIQQDHSSKRKKMLNSAALRLQIFVPLFDSKSFVAVLQRAIPNKNSNLYQRIVNKSVFTDLRNLAKAQYFINASVNDKIHTCCPIQNLISSNGGRKRDNKESEQMLGSMLSLDKKLNLIKLIDLEKDLDDSTTGIETMIVDADYYSLIEVLRTAFSNIFETFYSLNRRELDSKKFYNENKWCAKTPPSTILSRTTTESGGEERTTFLPKIHPLLPSPEVYGKKPGEFKLSAEQMECLEKINMYPIVFIDGNAGTGKSQLGAISLQSLHPDKVIYLSYMGSAVDAVGHKKVAPRALTVSSFLVRHAMCCCLQNLDARTFSRPGQSIQTTEHAQHLTGTNFSNLQPTLYTKPEWFVDLEDRGADNTSSFDWSLPENGGEERRKQYLIEKERSKKQFWSDTFQLAYDHCPLENLIDGRVFIDETSLMPTSDFCTLMYVLSRCCKGRISIVLAGDGKQLPSIEKGSLHKNLVSCMSKFLTNFRFNHRIKSQDRPSLLFQVQKSLDTRDPDDFMIDRKLALSQSAKCLFNQNLSLHKEQLQNQRTRNGGQQLHFRQMYSNFLPHNILRLNKPHRTQNTSFLRQTTLQDHGSLFTKTAFVHNVRLNVESSSSSSSSMSSSTFAGKPEILKIIGGINPDITKDIEMELIEIPRLDKSKKYLSDVELKHSLFTTFSHLLSSSQFLSHWMKYGETKETHILCRTNKLKNMIAEIVSLLCHQERNEYDFSRIDTSEYDQDNEQNRAEESQKFKKLIETDSRSSSSSSSNSNRPFSSNRHRSMLFQPNIRKDQEIDASPKIFYRNQKLTYKKNDSVLQTYNNVVYTVYAIHHVLIDENKGVKDSNGVINLDVQKLISSDISKNEEMTLDRTINEATDIESHEDLGSPSDFSSQSSGGSSKETRAKMIEEFYRYRNAQILSGGSQIKSSQTPIGQSSNTLKKGQRFGKRLILTPTENVDPFNRIINEDKVCIIPLTEHHLPHLKSATASTVNAAQGCEWETVIAVIPHFTKYDYLEMLQVAVTRARRRFILISETAIIAQILKNPAPDRRIWMGRWIAQKCSDVFSKYPHYMPSTEVLEIGAAEAEILKQRSADKNFIKEHSISPPDSPVSSNFESNSSSSSSNRVVQLGSRRRKRRNNDSLLSQLSTTTTNIQKQSEEKPVVTFPIRRRRSVKRKRNLNLIIKNCK